MPSATPWRRRALLLAVLPLFACAQHDARRDDPPPEQSRRVVLTTAREWAGAAEVADRAQRLAGVAVRDTMEIGPRRYRLQLVCADDAACKQAIARIAADRGFVLAVDPDARQQIPAKPSREWSR